MGKDAADSPFATRHSPLAPPLAPTIVRRNAAVLGGEMALFFTALALVAPLTLVPLFVSKVTDDPVLIGGLTSAQYLGWLPQLFAAGYVEQSARKLPWVLVFGALERLPALGLTLCAFAAPSLAAPLIIAIVYLCVFGQTLGGGLATTPWLDIVARSVPSDRRGQFIGGFTMLGTLLGAGAAALAAPLLQWLPFPTNFVACFGLATAIFLLGYGLLFFVVEPPAPPPPAPRSFGRQIGALPAMLADDPPFRRYLGGLSLAALGTMSAGFLVIYGVSRLGATDELAGWYTAALLIGQVLANPLLGWVGDRLGFHSVGRASALAAVGLAAVALIAPDALWLLPAFVLLGVGQAGMLLARLAGPIQFAPPERRPTYIALGSSLVALVSAVAPLAGGQIVARFGYESMFATSLVLSLIALVALGRETSRE